MNCLRICRFFDGHSVTLLNGELTIHRGAANDSRELHDLAEAALAAEFAMPRCPARAAIELMERISGRPMFDAAARASPQGLNRAVTF